MVDARIHAQWCACENLDAHQPHTKAKKATIPHLIPPSIYAIMYVLELDLAVESASHQYEWGNDLSNESFWPFWPFSGMVAKGEIFFFFTLFEKWKWKRNDWKSRSRSENEIKMTRDREVKFKKKISRILENRDSRRSVHCKTKKHLLRFCWFRPRRPALHLYVS